MLSAHEIQQALKSGNANQLADAYELITGKPLDRHCGSCLTDARTVLQVELRRIELESAPLHLYLINPSEETLWQCERLQVFDKITVVENHDACKAQFQPEAVNILSQDSFFDSTITEARKIKPYVVYALDAYKWNGNGHATLERGNVTVWISRGNKQGFSVTNPYRIIHAFRCD